MGLSGVLRLGSRVRKVSADACGLQLLQKREYPAAGLNEGEYAPTDSELVGVVRERDGLAILHNPIANKVLTPVLFLSCLLTLNALNE